MREKVFSISTSVSISIERKGGEKKTGQAAYFDLGFRMRSDNVGVKVKHPPVEKILARLLDLNLNTVVNHFIPERDNCLLLLRVGGFGQDVAAAVSSF